MPFFQTRTRTLGACAASLALLAVSESCKADPAPQVQPPSASTLSEVVVTGTRILTTQGASASPITQIAAKQIASEGLIRVEDAINRLPQAFADQTSGNTNGATGTATVNLRDLGPERTLVLIDGKRLMPGTPPPVRWLRI